MVTGSVLTTLNLIYAFFINFFEGLKFWDYLCLQKNYIVSSYRFKILKNLLIKGLFNFFSKTTDNANNCVKQLLQLKKKTIE
jgi:hypothetical protein